MENWNKFINEHNEKLQRLNDLADDYPNIDFERLEAVSWQVDAMMRKGASIMDLDLEFDPDEAEYAKRLFALNKEFERGNDTQNFSEGELRQLQSESFEEKEWDGYDPYEPGPNRKVDPTPIPGDQLTPAQVLSDKVEAFKKKHWSDLSNRELDYVNFVEDGLYFGFPKSARRSKEEYMRDIESALKSGDKGLMQYFKS